LKGVDVAASLHVCMVNRSIVLGTILLGVGVAVCALQRDPASSKPRSAVSAAVNQVAEEDEPALPEPQTSESPQPTEPIQPDQSQTESALMAKLRDIGESDPELSIKLAKVGDERFPNSPDAAERSWRVTKSLVNLKRFHAARDYVKVMVEKYRGTSWASDVERHLLVNPLDYPSREELQRRAARRSP